MRCQFDNLRDQHLESFLVHNMDIREDPLLRCQLEKLRIQH